MSKRGEARNVILTRNPNGYLVKVIEFVEIYSESTVTGPATEVEGLTFYRTDSGDKCNRISETEFQIVATEEILNC
jgi:hypothetical protein